MKNSSKIHLAIADDHVLFLNCLSKVITSNKRFVVDIEATNGKELINQIEATDELPDICLLDVRMPYMDGPDTLSQIQRRWPAIKILIVSSHSHEHIIINMIRNGANGYILKDTEPEEIYSAIISIYEKGFYHSELLSKYYARAFDAPELTNDEKKFITLCCQELTYKEMAKEMSVNPRTVERYREALFQKLDIKTRTGIVMFAVKCGLIAY